MPRLASSACAFALAALSSLSVSAQSFEATQPTAEGVQGVPGPGTLLWDNTQIASGTSAIVSLRAGNRPAGADQVNSADDFTVPAGVQWTISYVFSQGFSNAPTDANAFGVTVYQNNAGIPGAVVATRTVPFGGAVSMTTQELTLPTPIVVGPGNYWVSVFAIYDTFVDLNTTRWNWTFGPTPNGSFAASLQDTGSFFGSPIPWTTLGGLGVMNADSLLFALRGSSQPLQADLGLTKTAVAATPTTFGSQVTYTLTVANAGPGSAQAVTVVDPLPAALTYVSNSCGATAAGNTVTWNVGTLANGANASCSIVTTIRDFGPITNTATASSTTADPVAGNNSGAATISGASNAPMFIPTLQQLVLVLLGLLVAGVAVIAIRR